MDRRTGDRTVASTLAALIRTRRRRSAMPAPPLHPHTASAARDEGLVIRERDRWRLGAIPESTPAERKHAPRHLAGELRDPRIAAELGGDDGSSPTNAQTVACRMPEASARPGLPSPAPRPDGLPPAREFEPVHGRHGHVVVDRVLVEHPEQRTPRLAIVLVREPPQELRPLTCVEHRHGEASG
jgi:hypothetical protein